MKQPGNHSTLAVLVGGQFCHGQAIARRLAQAGHAVLSLTVGEAIVAGNARLADSDVAVLVINAPVSRTGLRFQDISDDDVDAALQGQVFDAVAVLQAVLPRMVAGGHIVLVGARGHLGAWGGVHLMAAGAALVALVRSLALELAPQGIHVNLVAADFVEAGARATPQSDGIAHAVTCLCDSDASISGETVLMDGHAALRMGESRRPRSETHEPIAVTGKPGAH